MKFKYTGNQDENTIRGVTFEKGKTVDVDDPEFIEKLSSHPDFTVVKRNAKNKK